MADHKRFMIRTKRITPKGSAERKDRIMIIDTKDDFGNLDIEAATVMAVCPDMSDAFVIIDLLNEKEEKETARLTEEIKRQMGKEKNQ